MAFEKEIENFCDTKDVKYLEKLPKEYQVIFKKYSVIALKEKNSNKEIANIVLKYFNLNSDGKKKFIKPISRENAESELKRMSIGSTGLRAGDILIGTHKGTKGALLQIHNNVYPSRNILDRIRAYPDLWERFLLKLGGIPFFSKMSIMNRDIWLDINEVENDFFDNNDKLQLLQPGVGDSEKKDGSIFVAFLPPEDLNKIVGPNPDSSDGYWSPQEINDLIIEYTGKSSTLVILKTFWKISLSYKVVKKYDKLVLNLEKSMVTKGGKTKSEQDIIVISNIVKGVKKVGKDKNIKWVKDKEQDIGILTSTETYNLKKTKRIIENMVDLDDNAFEIFKTATIGYTAAAYKSLLQKIIRFMPQKVNMGENVLPADQVLLICLSELMSHPGAFVPNIQRFVSGLESCAKRLAVTIYEDSSVDEEEFPNLFNLLAGALTAQRVKEWRPSEKIIKLWFKTALSGYYRNIGYIVDNHGEINREPYTLKADQYILKNSSAILDELRSFPGDLGLARGWARDYPKIKTSEAKFQPDVMPVYHCIDQHWAPSFVYFYDPEVILKNGSKNNWHNKSLTAKSSTPFGPLFINIFSKVTGVNPRFPRGGVHYKKDFEDIPFVEETRRAQQLFTVALQNPQKMRKSVDTIEIKYELPCSWLAGLVGVMKIKVRGAMTYVTMKSDDPLQLIAIREPRARRGKTSYTPLTIEQEEEAIKIAKERLRKGVSMNQATSPDVSLYGCKVYRIDYKDEPYYEIRKSGYKKSWDEARFLKINLEVYKQLSVKIKYALTKVGLGVEKNYEQSLRELIDETDEKILRRVLMYISTANSEIEMYRINRDGGGTTNSVDLYDVPAFQFLLRISLIAPGALRPIKGKPATFTVPVGPLLWTIRNMILDKTKNKISKETVKGWSLSKFYDERKLYDYQEETVNDMIKNFNDGLKGQFLWLPVGTGKSKIVLTYLSYLYHQKQLPMYIVYTLPPESAISIIEEIKMFGIKVNMIIPLKNITSKMKIYEKTGISITKGCDLKKFHINLILHDHLRKCADDLPKFAGDSIIVFDEVHLFLNQSIRTGMAMNLSHLSRQFISFTGTPVIDNKTEKLIAWLKQIVPFEVNKQNFWVAANNMIAKNITTGIKTESIDIVAPFNSKEQLEYQKYVPPALGGKNTNPSASDWNIAANICYKACDRKMISLTKDMLDEGRGVMIVARDTSHQQMLKKGLLANLSITSNDIFLIEKDKSIFLTDESVEKKKTPDYKIVITTKRKAQGYTLTRLSVMITSVYPSNNATREQLRGRINRVGQKTEPLLYYTTHIGILTNIMENHNSAKSLSAALQEVAEKV